MSDFERNCWLAALAIYIAAVLVLLSHGHTKTSWERWSIKVNAAHYDQQTGAWTEGPAVTTGGTR